MSILSFSFCLSFVRPYFCSELCKLLKKINNKLLNEKKNHIHYQHLNLLYNHNSMTTIIIIIITVIMFIIIIILLQIYSCRLYLFIFATRALALTLDLFMCVYPSVFLCLMTLAGSNFTSTILQIFFI